MQELIRPIAEDQARQLALEGRFPEAESILIGSPKDLGWLYHAWAKTAYEARDLSTALSKFKLYLEYGNLTDEDNFRLRVLILHLNRRLERTDGALEALRDLEDRYGASQDPFIRNELLNEREITEKRTVLESYPHRITIRFTNRCNILCVHCAMPTFTPWYVSEKTLNEVMALTPYLKFIEWQGGEPFVFNHRYFRNLLERAAQNPHLKQNIITNGLLIDRKWAEILIRCGVYVRISIDGATQEVYEKIRVGGKWEKLLQSIEMLNEERDRQNRKDLKLLLHMVVMRSNYHQLAEMMEFAREHRFDIVDYSHVVIGANDPSEDIFERYGDRRTWSILQEGRGGARRKADEYGIRFSDNLPFPPPGILEDQPTRIMEGPRRHAPQTVQDLELPEPLHCLSPWKQIIIREDGHLIANWHCCVKGRHMNIGHCDRQPLLTAWNSKFMQLLRMRIATRTQRGLCTSFCHSGALVDHWRDQIEW